LISQSGADNHQNGSQRDWQISGRLGAGLTIGLAVLTWIFKLLLEHAAAGWLNDKIGNDLFHITSPTVSEVVSIWVPAFLLAAGWIVSGYLYLRLKRSGSPPPHERPIAADDNLEQPKAGIVRDLPEVLSPQEAADAKLLERISKLLSHGDRLLSWWSSSYQEDAQAQFSAWLTEASQITVELPESRWVVYRTELKEVFGNKLAEGNLYKKTKRAIEIMRNLHNAMGHP
jgi:hypothetical protein